MINQISNYIFIQNILQIFFIVGLCLFINLNLNLIYKTDHKNYVFESFYISVFFLSSFFGIIYYFFKINHFYIKIFLFFFVFLGIGFFLFVIFKNFKQIAKFKIKSFLDYYILILFIFLFLLSLSPPSDIDSIDYHLGAPIQWYKAKHFYPRNDWLHYRLTGLGEHINLIGIYFKTFNFGQVIQFFSFLSLCIFGCSYIKSDYAKKIFIISVFSAPVIIFLVTTQKFQLLPAAIIFCITVYLSHGFIVKNDINFIIVIALAFAVGCKFSYIFPSSILFFYLLYLNYKARNLSYFILISIISFLVILFFPLYLKNFIFYKDPISPILENLKNFKDNNIINFLNYNKTFSNEKSNLSFLIALFYPDSLGGFTNSLGILFLFIFTIRFNKINLVSKKILIFIFINFLLIFLTYRGIARYYLELYFLAMFVLCKNYNLNYKFKFFKIVSIFQSLVIFIILIYTTINFFPGSLNKSNWKKVMSNYSYGFSIAEWVNKNINNKNKIILLSDIRFYSFFDNKFISDQYLKYKNKTEDYNVKKLLKKNENITYLLYRENSTHSNYIEKCVSYSEKKEKIFYLKYRNIFNESIQKKFYLLNNIKFIC